MAKNKEPKAINTDTPEQTIEELLAEVHSATQQVAEIKNQAIEAYQYLSDLRARLHVTKIRLLDKNRRE